MVQTKMDMIDNIITLVRSPGYSSKPMVMTVTKNRTGKSVMNSLYGNLGAPSPKFTLLKSTEIYGKVWITAYLTHEVAQWVKELNAPELWRNLDEQKWLNSIEISEKLHMLMVLRWA